MVFIYWFSFILKQPAILQKALFDDKDLAKMAPVIDH